MKFQSKYLWIFYGTGKIYSKFTWKKKCTNAVKKIIGKKSNVAKKKER